ncbi:MAG: hypothetical protein MO847_00045 [Candidatus Protistobacter heckmanni]|nr:hypothetical protein [Candidatus Protistobacter heckmanni]
MRAGQQPAAPGDIAEDEQLQMHWKGKNYNLPRQATVTGAERWFDPESGMDLVIVPRKAMLFNRKVGTRLTDDCKTIAMRDGATAPTRSEKFQAAQALAASKN